MSRIRPRLGRWKIGTEQQMDSIIRRLANQLARRKVSRVSDIVQNTWERLLRNDATALRTLEEMPADEQGRYLRTIIRRLVLDHQRRKRLRRALFAAKSTNPTESPPPLSIEEEYQSFANLLGGAILGIRAGVGPAANIRRDRRENLATVLVLLHAYASSDEPYPVGLVDQKDLAARIRMSASTFSTLKNVLTEEFIGDVLVAMAHAE